MILHADGNSFYASCEQIYRPDLRGKPVIVLSNNDGIIVALNQKAKDCGLKRGDPYFKVTSICNKFNVNVFSSNYTLYSDISRRITSIYLEYAPKIEEYSIDESFLFFDDCLWSVEEFEKIGLELKKRVYKEVGIPICVGAAPTKTLAKLYNKEAKKHGGVFVYREEGVNELLQSTECGKIWGIGMQGNRKLLLHGVKTAFDLKNLSLNVARKLLTVQGAYTVMELNGISCIDRVERFTNDVITSSRQFSKRIFDEKTLEKAVVQYAELAVEKLRLQKVMAKGVLVHLSTCNFYCNDESEQYCNSAFVSFLQETSYTPDIVKAAIFAMHSIFRKGFAYKTVMITLTGLTKGNGQLTFWQDAVEDVKKKNLMLSLDEITKKYGRNSLCLAKGMGNYDWQMKRSFLSPCCTTNIMEVPRIK